MKHVHRIVFIVVVVVSVLMIWPKLQRPPGWVKPRGGEYEYAEGTSRAKITVGPTVFEIDKVLRCQRDGTYTVHVPEGASPTPMGGHEIDGFSGLLNWMDIAKVKLKTDSDDYDVIELRVLNHDTRKILSNEDYPGIGWFIKDSDVVLYSIGKALPRRIDVWMRVQHRGGKTVYHLNPAAGSKVTLPGNNLRIADIAQGTYNWSGGIKSNHNEHLDSTVTSIAVEFDYAKDTMYQVCVIDKAGNRVVPENPHFICGANGWQLIRVGVAMGDIDTIEVSEFLGRDRLYFDNVYLPLRNDRLDDMPLVRYDVHGVEGDYVQQKGGLCKTTLSVLADVKVERLMVLMGVGCVYETKADEGVTSLICNTENMVAEKITFVVYDKEGETVDSAKVRYDDGMRGMNDSMFYIEVEMPVDEIDKVEVYFEEDGF